MADVQAAEYRWKEGTRISVAPAVAGSELQRIANRDGAVTPAVVVDENRSDEAPLHPCFEWDDETAAEAYREKQAAYLIRSLVTVYVRKDTDKELPPTRAFVKIQARPEEDASPEVAAAAEPHHYIAIQKVMSSDELRQCYIQQALRDLWTWRQRYTDIQEFARLFTDIEELRQEYFEIAA